MIYILLLIIILVVVFSPEYIQTRENLTKILYINDDIEEVNIEQPKKDSMDMLDDSSVEMNDEDANAAAEALLKEVKR